MSERTSGEGNTDAPKVEENEVRSGQGHEESGPRRVGGTRQGQEKGSAPIRDTREERRLARTAWRSGRAAIRAHQRRR